MGFFRQSRFDKKKKKPCQVSLSKIFPSRKTTQYNSQVYFTWEVTFVSNFSEVILN